MGVCCCASSSGRRFYAQSTFIKGGVDFERRQPQFREMIVVYLRLASGEKMACQILVLICRVKYYGRDLRTKGGGPFEDPGVFAAANCPSEVNRGRGEEEG